LRDILGNFISMPIIVNIRSEQNQHTHVYLAKLNLTIFLNKFNRIVP